MGTQNDLKYISIHALCHNNARFPTISIHALREESDDNTSEVIIGSGISIHALREESDHICNTLRKMFIYFNPRSP